MAEVAVPPAALALRRELEFVKSLLKLGRSVDEMVAAANAAARVAARAAEETKRKAVKGGTELTVRGLPAGGDWDWRSFKRWLQSRGMSQRSIKYTAKDVELDVGVVRFATEADCSLAADLLPTCDPPEQGGSGTIRVERGIALEYASKLQSRKRAREEDNGTEEQRRGACRAPKAPRVVPDVREAVCPWWEVPYSKQLTDKHQRVVEELAAITAEVDRRTHGASKPDWVRAAHARAAATVATTAGGSSNGNSSFCSSPSGSSSLCCPLLGILRSPAIERYRNKSEFTVGLDEQGRAAVGFLRGCYQDGIVWVGTPENTRHTSLTAIKLAEAAAAYIRDVSRFEVYDKVEHHGYWRMLLVREGSRRSFLPVPHTAAANAASADGAAAVVPPVLESPTFATLDPYTYLVTFKGKFRLASPPAEAAAEAAAGGDAPMVEAGGEAEGPAAAAMGGGGGGSSSSSSVGMEVSEVYEREPEQPPPDEVLVLLQVNPGYPRALSEPVAAVRELRGMTAALHAAAAAAGLPLTTVQVQLHSGVANSAPADAPLIPVPAVSPPAAEPEPAAAAAAVAACSGPGYIHDSLCELRFRISPTAFFQINSPAACLLYKVVGDWVGAAAGPSTLLLDICCGTGTIGLTLAGRVSKVIGVDCVPSAIEDARVNAALNGITNVEFVAAKAEDALPGILAVHASKDSPYGPGDVVAVADPPRVGLHRTVLRALLGCERIRRLIFVSCNPDNLVQNVAVLCCPPDNRSGRDRSRGRGRGGGGGGSADLSCYSGSYTPFRPVKALAVDLFPHTAHVETMMLLER